MLLCEFTRDLDGLPPCGSRAVFMVAAGSRTYNAQGSCGRHLGVTCVALAEADNRASVTVAPHPGGVRMEPKP